MCEMELWNEKMLPMPPINTYKAVKTNIDIQHLHNVFQEGKEFFVEEKYMHAEYAVLSRIVYRMKQKFRSAKDFKALEKLNKALDNYFKMDIAWSLQKFMDLIPSKYKDEIYLPTKNLLDYILVRLQGLVKLMERIVETSKIAAYLLDKRMHTGHFWKIAFITFSLVSRVYVLARYTAKFVCDFYRKLLPFSNQLNNTSIGWLPRSYALPKDLMEWLNVDWLEFDDEIQVIEVPTEIPDIMKFFDLVDDDDDVQFCDEYFMVDDDEDIQFVKDYKMNGKSKVQNTFLDRLGELRGFDSKEDIGEIIKIEDSFSECDQDIVPISSEAETDAISERIVSNSVTQPSTGDIDQLRKKRNIFSVSVMEIIDDDDDESRPGADRLTKNSDKGESNDNVLPVSDSEYSINESDEENVITISDNSLIETPSDRVNNISKQNNSNINVDSDDVTILDTPLPALTDRIDTDKKLKKSEKGAGRKLKLGNTVSKVRGKINEKSMIIVPDTPTLDADGKNQKKKIRKRMTYSNSDNVSIRTENNEYTNLLFPSGSGEEGVIILDTPVKASQNKKNKKVKGKVTKKVKKLRPYKGHIKKLEENITYMASVLKRTKGSKDKSCLEFNIPLQNNTQVELKNSSVLHKKKQNKLDKSQRKLNSLKNHTPKLNTNITSIVGGSNLVMESRHDVIPGMCLPSKKKKGNKKKQECGKLQNRQLKIKTKKLQNSMSKKQQKHQNEFEWLPRKENLPQMKVGSGNKAKKKKWKESNQSSVTNKQNTSPGNIAYQNRFNMPAELRNKKAMNKNFKQTPSESRYFIKLQSETLPQFNSSATRTFSNNSNKRKRYWEYSEEAQQANLGPNKGFNKKKKPKTDKAAVVYKSLPDVALRETANVPSNHNKVGSAVKQTKSEKRRKKRNKALQNLAQVDQPSRAIGGKLKYNLKNYHQTQKGKGFQNMRKDSRKNEYKRKL